MKYVAIIVGIVCTAAILYGLYSIIALQNGTQGIAFIAFSYSIHATWRTIKIELYIDRLLRGTLDVMDNAFK